MFAMTRSLMSAQRDASKRVAEARRFSVRLPLVGTVRVPPPDQLAFYGVLGGLAVLELIDWPVALAMGWARRWSPATSRSWSGARSARRARPAPSRPSRRPRQEGPAKKAPAKKARRRRPSRRCPQRKPPPRRPPRNSLAARKYRAGPPAGP